MAKIKIKDKKTGQVVCLVDDEGIMSIDIDKNEDEVLITIDKEEEENATN